MSSKLANKASHPSGRKAMQAVRASHKEERMKLHKIGCSDVENRVCPVAADVRMQARG
jgi:hypothetical protein